MRTLTTIGRSCAAVLLGAASLFPWTPVLAAVPNDPFYSEQWYLRDIRMPEAWGIARGSSLMTVAVLDSGVDLSHPDLRERIWANPGEIPGNGRDDDGNGYVDDVRGWDFVSGDADPSPDVFPGVSRDGTHHGTLVAGIIGAAGNNAEGVAGVNWDVRILPLRVLDENGSGSTLDVVRAVRYAVRAGAKIINVSFTGEHYSQSLADAFTEARDAGVLVVAAAGNEGDTERGGDLNLYPSYPACYRDASGRRTVLGVAALDRELRKLSFSSYGSDCIGISAPGASFYTTQVHRPSVAGFDEPYGDSWFGSSLSAPVVSGVAALLWSMDPSLDPDGIRAYLAAGARDIGSMNGEYAGHLGAGAVDAAASLLRLQEVLLGSADPPVIPSPSTTPELGTLIKLASDPAVYYFAADGRRYVFPNERTYRSWFDDAPRIRVITRSEMAKIPLGGNVTYRPGVRMVKVQTDPRVYAVSKNGVLRHVVSEGLAAALYGSEWNGKVDDLSDAFFVNYRIGPPIDDVFDYDPEAERNRAPTIDRDKNLLPTSP